MTREGWKDVLPLIQAFVEGAGIQVSNLYGEWRDQDSPLFVYPANRYRVKPEPKLIPFTFKDDLIGRIIKRKDCAPKLLITAQNDTSVYSGNIQIFYGMLLNSFTFLDGSPCGKMEGQ